MKRIALVLAVVWALLAVAAAAQDYHPLVEEGKTWWYRSSKYIEGRKLNFGVRIAESTTIDGVEWHACKIVEADNRSETLAPVICYVREQDKKVYFKPAGYQFDFENPAYSEILFDKYIMWLYPLNEELPAEGALIYDWTMAVGESYSYADVLNLQLTEISTVKSCGIERMEQKLYSTCYGYFSAVEGVGFAYNNWDSFFFWLQTDQIASIMQMWGLMLVGVTDPEEQTVWTFSDDVTEPWNYTGIEETVADTGADWSYSDGVFTSAEDGTLRVFDMAGREVASMAVKAGVAAALPVAPGLYVLELTTATATERAKIKR